MPSSNYHHQELLSPVFKQSENLFSDVAVVKNVTIKFFTTSGSSLANDNAVSALQENVARQAAQHGKTAFKQAQREERATKLKIGQLRP